jgi:uncharacterized protein (TIGR00251 family)
LVEGEGANMIIRVRVKPKSKVEYVKEISSSFYEVAVREQPEKGKANKRVVEVLSEFFKIPKERVKLISGETSRLKTFDIKITL